MAVPDNSKTDPVLQDPQKLFALAGVVAKAKQFGVPCTTVDDFVEYVKDPAAALAKIAGANGMGGSDATNALANVLPQLMGGQKLGLALDKGKLNKIALTGKRRTFRVEAWGEIDRKARDSNNQPVFPPIRTTVTGVWDTKVVNQNARKPDAPKGAWVYLRED
jgi:hypothetical protein